MNNNEKGTFAPGYYRNFKCTADKCRHSCCVGWQIFIDEITYEKYKKIKHIADTVEECEDGPCFRLTDGGRCPHLNNSGLCDIILKHGEDLLSDICKNHPRFFNDIAPGRTEVGLGIVCEEACRLILEDNEPFRLYKINDSEEIFDGTDETDIDPMSYRDRIISAVDSEINFDEKINVLKTEFNISLKYDSDEWLDRFLSLEILDKKWEEDLKSMRGKLFRSTEENTKKFGIYYARLLKYFIYRHVSISDSIRSLRSRLAFSVLSVEVIRSFFESESMQTLDRLIECARRYSAEIEYSEDNTDELIFSLSLEDR